MFGVVSIKYTITPFDHNDQKHNCYNDDMNEKELDDYIEIF